MREERLPDFVQRLDRGTAFSFACRRQLNCFTECCRLLELALTPYDVLRLRRATGLSSDKFLERFVIVEQEDDEVFPRLYLTMIDDGRGSCPFVSQEGCTVYEHRPGACRAYPVGRGVIRRESGVIDEDFVLVREEHCLGFEEAASQTAEEYCLGQGLPLYNHFNDLTGAILQHRKVRRGMVLPPAEKDLFLLVLYDLDRLRTMLEDGEFSAIDPVTALKMRSSSDEDLLQFAVSWLKDRLFG
jgi:hypothetical protein